MIAQEEDIEAAEAVNEEREAEDNRVRFSRLKLMGVSPAHYLNPPTRRTTSMDKGSAVHAILDNKRVIYYAEKTKTGRSAPRIGDKWEQFQRDNSDALILSAKEYDDVNGMVDSVRAHPSAMRWLTGVREETLSFDLLGIPCRTTPDVRGDTFFTEVKTCQTSDPRRFQMKSFWMHYHAQMAMHRLGIKRAAKDCRPDIGKIVVVESTKPFPVTVFTVQPPVLASGEKLIRIWMETLKACLQSNEWPPYAQYDVDLELPEDPSLEFDGGGEDGEQHSADNLPGGW